MIGGMPGFVFDRTQGGSIEQLDGATRAAASGGVTALQAVSMIVEEDQRARLEGILDHGAIGDAEMKPSVPSEPIIR